MKHIAETELNWKYNVVMVGGKKTLVKSFGDESGLALFAVLHQPPNEEALHFHESV